MWEWFGTIFSVVLLLAGFALVLMLAYWTTRMVGRRYGAGMNSGGSFQVLDRMAMGQDRMLCIVQVADKTLLLGVTPQTITNLGELDAGALPELTPTEGAGELPGVFADLLKTVQMQNKKTPEEEGQDKA